MQPPSPRNLLLGLLPAPGTSWGGELSPPTASRRPVSGCSVRPTDRQLVQIPAAAAGVALGVGRSPPQVTPRISFRPALACATRACTHLARLSVPRSSRAGRAGAGCRVGLSRRGPRAESSRALTLRPPSRPAPGLRPPFRAAGPPSEFGAPQQLLPLGGRRPLHAPRPGRAAPKFQPGSGSRGRRGATLDGEAKRGERAKEAGGERNPAADRRTSPGPMSAAESGAGGGARRGRRRPWEREGASERARAGGSQPASRFSVGWWPRRRSRAEPSAPAGHPPRAAPASLPPSLSRAARCPLCRQGAMGRRRAAPAALPGTP